MVVYLYAALLLTPLEVPALYGARLHGRQAECSLSVGGDRALFVNGVRSNGEGVQKQALYPKDWDVEVPKGTKLDALRKKLEQEANPLPEKDFEDQSPLPMWFRVYLRKNNPDLPKSGPYQYPRTARRLLQWLIEHPDSFETP